MVNKVILIGRVGTDPEVRMFENGGKIARLRLATSERIFNPATQQQMEHTEWHTLIFRRGLASVVEMYVKKGTQIYVEGRIRSRQWEDASKVQHTSVEIYVDDMRMMGGRPREDAGQPVSGGYPQESISNTGSATEPVREMNEPMGASETDDLPF